MTPGVAVGEALPFGSLAIGIGMPPKRPASRQAAAPVAMEAGGNSDDWVRTKSNQKRLANLMLASGFQTRT